MRRQRGVVLVIVLAALAGVLAGIAIYAMNQKDAVKTTLNRTEQRRARLAAEAGIQYALASLQSVADAPQDPVTLNDDWASLGTTGADYFVVGSESFRVQIIDNSQFLDVNTITEETLNNLPLTQEQIDSFLDWREAGSNPRNNGGKDEYYNNLSNPYNTREGKLQTVNELLQIKSWTPETLYAIPTAVNTGRTTNSNTPTVPLSDILGIDCYSGTYNPEGDGKVNVNQQNLNAQTLSQNAQVPLQVAQAIVDARATQPNGQYTRLSQVLAVPGVQGNQQAIRGVLDRMTTSTGTRIEGLVNINTATADSMSLIPGVTQDLANQIVDSRPSDGYRQLSDILTVSSDSSFLNAVADTMTVNSQSFIVRCVGKAGQTTVALEAYVTITNSVPTITRVQESNFSNMPERWAWADEANETTLLEQ